MLGMIKYSKSVLFEDQTHICVKKKNTAQTGQHYHWRELPQVSFLLWQNFCWDKHICRDKYLSWPKKFCRDKIMFVTASILLSWQKTCFVMTSTCFLWQNFCRNKYYTCCSSRQWYNTTLASTKLKTEPFALAYNESIVFLPAMVKLVLEQWILNFLKQKRKKTPF